MVCDSVRSCVTTSPAAVNRPTDLIFGMYMDIGDRMLIIDKSRSKVRGQGQKSTKKLYFLGQSWVQKGLIRTREGHVGYFWQHANYFGILPNVVGGQGTSSRKVFLIVAGGHYAIARCEVYLSMYITSISVSMPTPWAVTGPNGQLASKVMVWEMNFK